MSSRLQGVQTSVFTSSMVRNSRLLSGILINVFTHGGVQRTTETTEIGDAGKLRQFPAVRADIDVAHIVYEGEAEITVYIPHDGLFVERVQDVHRVADKLSASPHAFLLLALLVGLHPVEQ